MAQRKSLVTGGAGFIGSHLVDTLIDRGDAVTVIDWVHPTVDRKNAQAVYVLCDIRDRKLENIVQEIAPDVVFHLAAHIDDRASVLDPIMNAEHNELGSINVFESSWRAKVQTVVFASSCAVYGEQNAIVMTESMRPRPKTPYGISKLSGETYLDSYTMREKGICGVALRFGNVYGPRQEGNKESGAIAIFTEKLLAGVAPFVNNDGKTTRDYVFVHDVVAALVAAGLATVSGVYNVGTGREVSTQEVFDCVKREIGGEISQMMRPEVSDALKHISLDTSAIRAAMHWESVTTIEEGIRQTIAWYKNRKTA